MADYASLRAVAERLISQNGRDLTFFQDPEPENEDQPWKGSSEDGTQAIAKGVVVEYESTLVDGSLVLVGDKKCITQMPDGTDDPRDWAGLIDSDGESWRIVSIQDIMPGSTRLLCVLQLRR